MMIKRLNSIALFLLSTAAYAQQPLEGIEVLGNKHISRDLVLKGFPVQLGTPFGPDFTGFRGWCDQLEERLHVPFARCSMVGYGGGKIYAVIDLVEENEQDKVAVHNQTVYRDITLDPILYQLSRRFTSVWIEKLKQNADTGYTITASAYLSFKDPDLASMANELFKLASAQKQDILNVLAYSKNGDQRAEAASLLKWCGDPDSAMSVAIHSVRDDNSFVRNNIVQFISYFFSYTKTEETNLLISDLAWQLNMPSHSDRNKALGVLFLLIQKRPEIIKTVDQIAGEQVRYLAANSILPNVGGLARKIIEQMNTQ